MPNWAEGNIRVRGKRENIIRYIQENLLPQYELQNNKWETRPLQVEETAGGYELMLEKNPETDDMVWFKDSSRQFLDFDGSDYMSGEFSDDAEHINSKALQAGNFCNIECFGGLHGDGGDIVKIEYLGRKWEP